VRRAPLVRRREALFDFAAVLVLLLLLLRFTVRPSVVSQDYRETVHHGAVRPARRTA
jgi:hypothetical protein